MPRHQEPKKDVISCDKLRVGANIHLSVDVRMRELKSEEKLIYLYVSKVAYKGERWELKHLSTNRKRKKNRFCE